MEYFMMVVMILSVSLAFLWLMIESKWLTIRLPQYYRERLAIEELCELVPVLVMVGFICAATCSGFVGIKKLGKKKQKGVNWRQWFKTWLNPREWLSFLLGAIVILELRYSPWMAKYRENARKTKETRVTPKNEGLNSAL